MKTYEVVCEGVVQRMILVTAVSPAHASKLARREFSALTGAQMEGVAVLDIYSEKENEKD